MKMVNSERDSTGRDAVASTETSDGDHGAADGLNPFLPSDSTQTLGKPSADRQDAFTPDLAAHTPSA